MPYVPNQPGEENRNFALQSMWVGFAAAWLLLAGKAFGFFDHVDAIGGGFASGSLIGLIFFSYQDEYMQRLIGKASAWSCAVVGLWLFASVVSFTSGYVQDHVFGLIIVAVTFQTSFAISRIRGYC
ncbi:hypothetical protein [Erythrobacter sp. MTPC3]|uniref:hypothetical protein n=1 Tax=Erythrobacter sp. MTPC3 TaxID=3056564 RepID=UPI0036F43A4F